MTALVETDSHQTHPTLDDGSRQLRPAFGQPGFGLGAVRPSTARSRVTNRSLIFDPSLVDGRSPRARRFRDVAADLLKLVESPSVQHKLMARRIAGLVVGLEDVDHRMAAGEAFSVKNFTNMAAPPTASPASSGNGSSPRRNGEPRVKG